MRRSTRTVVVGAGLAGVRTAQSLRRHGYGGAITIIGAEPDEPYNRPPLTKAVLRGDCDAPELLLRGGDSWHALGVEAHLGRRAVAIDSSPGQVHLDNGRSLPFDQAVVATGVQARSLPWQAWVPGVHTIRTYGDAIRLRNDLDRQRPRVVIIGGGFLGCEAASSIRSHGLEVTVVEFLGAPLSGVLGMTIAGALAQVIESSGVQVRASTAVQTVSAGSGGYRMLLSDGTELSADVLVAAVGTSLDLGWLAGAGIATDNGVLCDSFGRASAPGIFAAGDAARWWQPYEQAHSRYEHWTSAVQQAEVVARNIVSGGRASQSCEALPYVWSDQFGLKLQLLGRPDPGDPVTFLYRRGAAGRDIASNAMLAAYSRSGTVTGVFGLSLPSVVARLRPKLSRGMLLADLCRQVDGLVASIGS